ncbi:copper resistance CopC family protein [Microbispora sp. H11081]|uniref:copper resistance CopC family protein n=1 Tax=Microbispora sp. H11081 TaxID=2729107 RepID=UPI001472B191|nr:copper resistance CopC family protein [Microbispora sp. H11081]
MRYAHIVIRLLAAVAVVAAVVAGVAGPAAAHAALRSSTPKDGATVNKAPSDVELVFTENIARQFVTVVVTGPDGRKVTRGGPSTKGPVVTQPLTAGLPNGRYAIAYRVVSSDGHPVSGELHFTLKAPAAVATPAATPAATSAAAAGPSPAGADPAGVATSPSAPAADASLAASSSPGGGRTVAVVAAVAVVAVAGGILVVSRRRRAAGS